MLLCLTNATNIEKVMEQEVNYAPFITEGFVSLVCNTQKVPIKIDTGASESLVLQFSSFSSDSNTGSCVLIRGIKLQPFFVALHKPELYSGLVTKETTMAVCPALPIEGVDVILGNNLASGCVWSVLGGQVKFVYI